MSFSVVIRCGRDWVPGDPCRQAEPLGVVAGWLDARQRARRLGWSVTGDPADPTAVDACPACTRRDALRQLPPATRELAVDQLVDAGVAALDRPLPAALGGPRPTWPRPRPRLRRAAP